MSWWLRRKRNELVVEEKEVRMSWWLRRKRNELVVKEKEE